MRWELTAQARISLRERNRKGKGKGRMRSQYPAQESVSYKIAALRGVGLIKKTRIPFLLICKCPEMFYGLEILYSFDPITPNEKKISGTDMFPIWQPSYRIWARIPLMNIMRFPRDMPKVY
jgi:hypothetical protein